MPLYMFRCSKCDDVTQKVMPVSQSGKPSIRCGTCGDVAFRDIVSEHRGVAHHPGNWPLLSDAAGVHPAQVGEATAEATKVGVPTNFTEDGRAIFTSAGHRKKFCEAHGLFDRNAGYSDPQRRRS